MYQQKRRNYSNRRNRSEAPYNELYEAFKPFFSPIFTERFSEGLRAKTYVNVPEVEADIDSYLMSDLTGIAVLNGLMGAGKSSILEHYSDANPAGTKKSFLYLNFAGRRYHFMPKEDFIALSSHDRKLFARAQATRRLNELLLNFLKDNIDLIDVPYFDFLVKNNLTEIGAEALFVQNDADKMDIVKKFMSDADSTAPMQCFLRYVANVKKIEVFTIAIDNVDEQPFEMVEGLFFALTDFVECMMRPRNDGTIEQAITDQNPYGISQSTTHYDTRFHAILACRAYTFEALKMEEGGIYQTRGCEEISLNSNSILIDILRSRISHFRKVLSESSKGVQKRPYKIQSGANVQLDDAFDFLENFIEEIFQKALESPLFHLFNHNYARCIQNIKYIIQNRYFLLFDTEIMHQGSVELEFHYHRVLRALGYGNPKNSNKLFFPAQSTVITNILSWDPGRDGSFLAIIKVLSWINLAGFTSEASLDVAANGCTVGHSVQILTNDFGLKENIAKWSISFCHANGLLFAASGYRSPLSDDEVICMSPKGRAQLNEFYKTDVYLEMFIDDIFPVSDIDELSSNRPPVQNFQTLPRRIHFEDKLKWLKGFLDAERRLLEELKSRNISYIRSHLKLFGGKLFSHVLADAFDGFYNSYYKNFCNRDDRNSLNDFVSLCKDATRYFSH